MPNPDKALVFLAISLTVCAAAVGSSGMLLLLFHAFGR